MPSRYICMKDCLMFYMEEREKLKSVFVSRCPRVCFTTIREH